LCEYLYKYIFQFLEKKKEEERRILKWRRIGRCKYVAKKKEEDENMREKIFPLF